MLYTQLTVKFLEHLADANGAYSGLANATAAKEFVEILGEGDESVTVRKVHMAFQELRDAGLLKVGRLGASDLSRDSVLYLDLDITGQGERFVESLRVQARTEGKGKGWLWSMVEKAATIAQLVSLAMQAAGRS